MRNTKAPLKHCIYITSHGYSAFSWRGASSQLLPMNAPAPSGWCCARIWPYISWNLTGRDMGYPEKQIPFGNDRREKQRRRQFLRGRWLAA